MFDLVDKRLSPRIAKLTEKQLYRPRPASHYKQWPRAGPLLRHHAQIDAIDAQWDDLLRIGASLKQGYVSAALLIARLQAGSRQHPLAKAMLSTGSCYGRFTRCAGSPTRRSAVGSAKQLNRGEALNDLRRFIFFANRGTVRYSGHEDQTTQAHCHTLVVNLCILSTTGYLQDAIDAQRADGHAVSSEAIANLSPAQFETINPYGTLTFDIPGVLERPRRPPAAPNAH